MLQYSPILGIRSTSSEALYELVDIFNGVRDMGFKIEWNTDIWDAFMFLVEKNEGIVIEKSEEKKLEFISWVKGLLKQKKNDNIIHWGYMLLKDVQSQGV